LYRCYTLIDCEFYVSTTGVSAGLSNAHDHLWEKLVMMDIDIYKLTYIYTYP